MSSPQPEGPTTSESPDLVAVPRASDSSSTSTSSTPKSDTPSPAPAPKRSSFRATLLSWLLAAALVVVCVLLVWEKQTTAQLGREVDSLQSDLTAARAEVAVHEARLADVRVRVADIATRVGALQGVVGVAEGENAAVELAPIPAEEGGEATEAAAAVAETSAAVPAEAANEAASATSSEETTASELAPEARLPEALPGMEPDLPAWGRDLDPPVELAPDFDTSSNFELEAQDKQLRLYTARPF